MNEVNKKDAGGELGCLGSGSNITQTQYLARRVVHVSNKRPEIIMVTPKKYGLDEIWKGFCDVKLVR